MVLKEMETVCPVCSVDLKPSVFTQVFICLWEAPGIPPFSLLPPIYVKRDIQTHNKDDSIFCHPDPQTHNQSLGGLSCWMTSVQIFKIFRDVFLLLLHVILCDSYCSNSIPCLLF